MKSLRIFPSITLALLISACLGGANLPSTPTQQPAAPTFVELPTRLAMPTRAPTLTSTPEPLAQSTPPAWVAEFADPLLKWATGQYPSFEDDFTANLNKGWFYLIDDNALKPYFAHLEQDALILRIPDGPERREVMAYSPHLTRRNFVLSLDFKFEKTEPNDIFRIEFIPSADQTISVDLSKNESASISWNLHNHWKSSFGLYDHFGPALVNVILIMVGEECALYINHDPLGYLSECRSAAFPKLVHQALSVRLLSTTGNPATVVVDNVKIWDLDKNMDRPELP
jgi:hypothetical protein